MSHRGEVELPPDEGRHEVRDGMQIDWQVAVAMDDGLSLRCDVYRPEGEGRFPVLVSYGPYAKGLLFQEGYKPQWDKMVSEHPDVMENSTNSYQSWEVVDPEKWVPHGYCCVRVDSRGTGWSPGNVDVWSPREALDLARCIEWAGTRPWSSGRVGLCGVSYYAMNQWHVAALAPPHLHAMVPWEGAADFYRDVTHHGGILCEFTANWYRRQVESVQYGVGERSQRNPNTGEPVAGPVTLSDGELARNRHDLGTEVRNHNLDDDWHRARSADWQQVRVPFLSAANWGGQGLHPRGNFEAFTEAASSEKWLEVHGLEHWTHFYTDYGVDLQRRFFDHFLKDIDNGWDRSPRVRLNVRRPREDFELRDEDEWPLARTCWTRLYLDAATMGLAAAPCEPAQVSYEALGDGVSFVLAASDEEIEITGPLAARLFVASSTVDADLFTTIRLLDPAGDEVTFQGALDPNTPIAQGWLRASHRALDASKSLPYRPYHTHDREELLQIGEIVEVEVELWPTCIVVPPGYQVVVEITGRDYRYGGELSAFAKSFYYANRGVGPFTHADPLDRPADRFGGTVTLYTGGEHLSSLLVPVIPPR
ncbi:MAG: CocE/NonD family hydrolase [Acidimicrobiales bacterium]